MNQSLDQLLAAVPLDVVAVGAGSVMGAVIAVRRDFDVMGVIGLAVISGVGGGVLRDTLLQQGPPAALRDWRYGLAVLIGGVVGAFFAAAARRAWTVLLVIDSIALGLFAAVGASLSLDAGLPTASAIAIGTTAAVGGWVIRDIVTGVIPPDLFKPGDLHGAAALLGCLLFVVLVSGVGAAASAAALACIALTFALRWTALHIHLRTPRPHDYSPHWLKPS